MQILKRLLLPLELYILLSSFIFTEQFDRNLELDAIGDGSVKDLLKISHGFLDALTNHENLIGGIFFVYISIVIIWRLFGKTGRLATDSVAIFLSLCWVIEFVIMNLLLVAPIKSPILLITELLLFIPIIVICFSWWYWRLNLQRKNNKVSPAIILDDKPGAIEYFFFSAEIFFNYSQESCKTTAAKFLRLINGFIVLDIFGLTLSRAVDLAIG